MVELRLSAKERKRNIKSKAEENSIILKLLNDFTMEEKEKENKKQNRIKRKTCNEDPCSSRIVEFCLDYLKSHTPVIDSEQNINDLQPRSYL